MSVHRIVHQCISPPVVAQRPQPDLLRELSVSVSIPNSMFDPALDLSSSYAQLSYPIDTHVHGLGDDSYTIQSPRICACASLLDLVDPAYEHRLPELSATKLPEDRECVLFLARHECV